MRKCVVNENLTNNGLKSLNCADITGHFHILHGHKNGTEAGIRTQDPRFRRPMLYPAELLPHIPYLLAETRF